MRWLWKLITAELEITLALLMLLGSIVVLSWVYAGTTGDINVTLTVTSETGGGNGGGGGGGGGGYEPAKPPPEEIKPPVKPRFILTDYSPKIMVHNRLNQLFLYGKNPEDLMVRLANQSMTYTTASYRTVTAAGESDLAILEYLIPAFSLPKGLIDLQITSQRDNTVIADNLSIYVIDALPSQELKAKATVLNIGTIELLSQAESKVKVKFTNTGTLEWNNFLQPLHIGTSRPRDRKSKFIHLIWPYSDRTVRAVLPNTIKPGESFDIEFTVLAPAVKYSTRFTEYFALVADGLTWIQDSEFKVSILVKPLPQQKSTVIVKPAPKPTTGGITQPEQPKTPSPYQRTQVPQFSVINWLNDLFQKIKLFFKF